MLLNIITSILLDTKLFGINLTKLEDKYRLLGIKLINFADLFEVLLRFSFTLLIFIIIIRYLYYPIARRKEYLFTFLMFGIVVFFVCLLLASVKLQLGFALGLFAIFSLLRYRTDVIPIKEMTYLFIVIGISVINSLSTNKVSYAELLFTNFAIVITTYLLERKWFQNHELVKLVNFEKIELIKPEKQEELLADLRERTGLKIHRFEIVRINFVRDVARIKIFYYNEENNTKK